ncbi:MAG: hypothetical protein D6797_00320 [Bdellovibrio sp.]|nr:MAG: hypothetical protein D6797_00320 [Bdellovibrio sp.]
MKALLTLLLVFSTTSLWAQQNFQNHSASSQTNTTNTPPPNNGPSMSGAAKQSMLINAIAGGANIAAAAMAFRACGPHNPWPCALGASLAAQAAQNFANRNQAAGSYGQSTWGGLNLPDGFWNETGLTEDLKALAEENGLSGFKNPSDLSKLSQKLLRKIQDQSGVSIDPRTGNISTPKGTIPAGASLDSLVASGFMSPEEKEEAEKLLEQINQKTAKAQQAIKNIAKNGAWGVGSGGGYVSRGASRRRLASINDNAMFKNLFAQFQQKKKTAPQLSGLKRIVAGGEPIGTRYESIFDMIRKAYNRKQAANEFLR